MSSSRAFKIHILGVTLLTNAVHENLIQFEAIVLGVILIYHQLLARSTANVKVSNKL